MNVKQSYEAVIKLGGVQWLMPEITGTGRGEEGDWEDCCARPVKAKKLTRLYLHKYTGCGGAHVYSEPSEAYIGRS
jgi:hypothetical protein